jgi:sporulation protein YlmC with PRC-barrel domain
MQASGREQGAYGNGSSAASSQAGQSAQGQRTLRASELIGEKVVDQHGEEVGEIDEIVIDLNSGNARAAVLSVGGFLGIGDKQVAVPMSDIGRGQGGEFTANLDKKKLEDAEGFAKGQMPGMNDEYWARTGGQSSGSTTTNGGAPATGASGGAQQSPDMNLVRASEMEGREVQDRSGNAVGEVRDVVVSVSDGKIEHVVVDVKDAGEARINPDAFSSGTGDRLVVDMSREQLASQAMPSRDQRESRSQTGQPLSGQAQRSGGWPPQERPPG